MSKMQKVQKWGNSLAVRIPKEAASRAGLNAGDTVAVSAGPGRVTIIRKRHEYCIEDLVAQMTPENQPELVDWGPRRGKEFW
jgi:antitoxin MazE